MPMDSDDGKKKPTFLEPELVDLSKILRAEANDLKEWFTKYSFQAVAFSGLILGILVRYLWSEPATGLGSIAVIAIVLVASRLGTFKYGAANRNLAYELHLYRTKDVPERFWGRWHPSMRAIGWEEAMRAWRIVQATIFEQVYKSSTLWPNFTRRRFRNPQSYWFSQKSLLGEELASDVSYHPGSYLRTMILFLQVFAVASLACLAAMTVRVYLVYGVSWAFVSAFVITVFMCAFTILRMVIDHWRRLILEDGLLSIHSSAIIWQAVVVAHFTALEKARESNTADGAGYRGYTRHLGEQARSLARHLEDIHTWIATPPRDDAARDRAPDGGNGTVEKWRFWSKRSRQASFGDR